VPFRQPFIHRRRHQEHGLPLDGAEIAHVPRPVRLRIVATILAWMPGRGKSGRLIDVGDRPAAVRGAFLQCQTRVLRALPVPADTQVERGSHWLPGHSG
jgi:hypothetical protein